MKATWPEYLHFGRERLPRGGPDRVRFCVWYADALDEGKDDAAAREHAFGCLRLMHMYAGAGIIEKLGPAAAGIPLEHLGEE